MRNTRGMARLKFVSILRSDPFTLRLDKNRRAKGNNGIPGFCRFADGIIKRLKPNNGFGRKATRNLQNI